MGTPDHDHEDVAKVVDDATGKAKKLRRHSLFSYNNAMYELFDDPDTKTWYVRRLGKGSNIIKVFTGDIDAYWVFDDALNKMVYVIKTSDVIVYGLDQKTVIKGFLTKVSGFSNSYFMEWILRDLLGDHAKLMDGYVCSGFYANGFMKGFIPYPATSWECDPKNLESIAKYIVDAYPPANRIVALANVAFAIAKVFSPAVRLARAKNKHESDFRDNIVINIGGDSAGKTNLSVSIINLLALDPKKVLYVGDEPIMTREKIKDLLMESNAPLFLDNVGEQGLREIVRFAPHAVFARIDKSIRSIFKSIVTDKYDNPVLRSIMMNTSLDQDHVEKVLIEYYNTPGMLDSALRYLFLLINWAKDRIKPGVEPYSGKPIMGCLRELWGNADFHQYVMVNAHDTVKLAKIVMETLHKTYHVDTSIYIKAIDDALTRVGPYENVA